MTYYITFGQSHTHPVTGDKMKDYWIEVESDTAHGAATIAKKMFGDQWGDVYSDKTFNKSYFPLGNYEKRDSNHNLSSLFERKLKKNI